MDPLQPVPPPTEPAAPAATNCASAAAGLFDAATLDEARTLLDAGLATARATWRLAGVEWQLCKAGWARLLWLMPLFVVLALSVWASLLVALFSLVMALSGGAVVVGWISVIGAQILALLVIGWQIQRALSASRFAHTRAALSVPSSNPGGTPP
jgi:uncharacterized membrane protein YqjE